jgi:UDP-glucose 4-epimerase
VRVLITGGAGFIGSHLADAFVARGQEVDVIDDLSTGRLGNVAHLVGHPRFHLTVGEAQNRSLMKPLIGRADAIFHLAAAVGVKLVIANPVRAIQNNLQSAEVVFDLASLACKRVLLASTSEVYGHGARIPFREDGSVVLGASTTSRWNYACAKLVDECLGLAYWHERRLQTIVVRLFNTVGPRQTGKYGMVLPTFVRQALAGEPITVYGDGTQSRCFAYVGDVVGALVALMAHPDAPGGVFNVGSTEEITILDLARRVKELTESPSDIVLLPYQEAYADGFEDVARRVPDLSRIGALIGYRPWTSLDAIIRAVAASHAIDSDFARETAAALPS